MRYIDLRMVEVCITPKWLIAAQKAQNKVKNVPIDERSSAINRRSQIWSQLKETLGQVSHKKCWYCETVKIRDDFAVDHFRPKNEVKDEECLNHPGYWWLAFDWRNFRYSCKYCNERRKDLENGVTGGKSSFFPLLDERKRVYDENGQIAQEEPVLLDPTVKSDPPLLTFYPNGLVQPAWKKEQDQILYRRAKTSILLYNLNLRELKERRQYICNKVVRLIARANNYYTRLVWGDELAEISFKEALEDLRDMMSEKSEYSAAARATLMSYRTPRWLTEETITYLLTSQKDATES